jgi:hypothetical protein
LIQATVEVMERSVGDVGLEWHDRRHLRLSKYAAGHRGHHLRKLSRRPSRIDAFIGADRGS